MLLWKHVREIYVIHDLFTLKLQLVRWHKIISITIFKTNTNRRFMLAGMLDCNS